jgi:perosamine synthetase
MIELFETRITAKAKQLVNEVLDSGFLNQGKMVDELEKTLARDWGLRNPVTLNSCTSSLHLALILSGVEPGDDVILPAQTFIATGLAVLMVGAKPCFVDINDDGNISPTEIEKRISCRTKAIIVVHWGGTKADMLEINKIAKKHNLKVIEDAAHAFGQRDSIGGCIQSDFCCFSLQSIKTLTSADGGILCCKSFGDYERAIKLRWFGMDKKSVVRNELGERISNVSELGYKYHMNDYSAALALGNLYGLGDALQRRSDIGMKYYYAFRNHPNFIPASYSVAPRWLYTCLADRRDDLILYLKRHFIQASKVDSRIDKNDIFSKHYLRLINQEKFEERQVSIPCTSKMTDEDVQRVINTIEDFYGK